MLRVSMVTLSKWERDHTYPTWEYHARLIDYLGYDVFKLTGFKDPYSNKSRSVAFFAEGEGGKIAERIRKKRLELKLTVDKCARKLGVSARTLRDWEAAAHVPLKRFETAIKSFLA